MIYFTADLHFYHANIIKYEDRPFASVGEMNTVMINNWKQVVKPGDDVYILGDFMFGTPEQANGLLDALPGRKHLVKGNHDSFLKDKRFDREKFVWIRDYHVLKYDDRKFVLFHYPIAVWDCQHHGSIHLYGHVHSNPGDRHPQIKGIDNAFNVGVDVCDYAPVSIESILRKAK